MSDSEATGTVATATAPDSDDHAVGDGHDDDHGVGHAHDEAALGPIDLEAWGAGLLGLLLGGVVALAIALSTDLLTV